MALSHLLTSATRTGTVKNFGVDKGYGFVTTDDDKTDIFLTMSAMGGKVVDKGDKLSFTVEQGDESKKQGLQAKNVTFLSVKEEDIKYKGTVKSYVIKQGYGFITTNAFEGDIFFSYKDTSPAAAQMIQEKAWVIFKVAPSEKGTGQHAKDVRLCGAAAGELKRIVKGGGKGKGDGKFVMMDPSMMMGMNPAMMMGMNPMMGMKGMNPMMMGMNPMMMGMNPMAMGAFGGGGGGGFGGIGVMQPHFQKKGKGKGGGGSCKNKGSCKWCELGQCWNH